MPISPPVFSDASLSGAPGDSAMATDGARKDADLPLRAPRIREVLWARLSVQTDRAFARLLILQTLITLPLAWWVTPHAWAWAGGISTSATWSAVLLTWLVSGTAAALAWWRAGEPVSRYAVAVAQVTLSAVLVHLTGGRIESHFHLFGSLAFLAFYRDWRVLVTASALAILDLVLRGTFWPQSVFGEVAINPWRWLEHGAWILFENVFLILACVRSQQLLVLLADQQQTLEQKSADVAAAVETRTRELAQANVELQSEVEERRRVERELQAAKDAAEGANRAKSEFLANMSHEIRTPMNGVIGMTSLLLDTKLDEVQRGFAETIRQSGDSLLTIINDILDFSKIEAGCMELDRHPFEVRACVEDTLDLFTQKAGEKGLDVGCQIHDGVPVVVEGDVTRLRQVLVNLVGNAVKFTEQGNVLVEVVARPLPGEDLHELWFRVHDTGLGIAEERMDRLFKLFSQVDASLSRRYGGTGLGLAISKRLVELMGGRIWVQSSPGTGSIFNFTVRLKVVTESLPLAAPSETAAILRGRRVLVVDDQEVNRRVLKLQTQRWGMIPHAVGSATEALAWLADGQVDVALVDMCMPEMNGVELAARIHALPGREELSLILLSSGGAVLRSDAPGREHFTSVFLKPLKLAPLRLALERAIERAQLHEREKPASTAPSVALEVDLAARLPLRILLVEDNVVNQRVALRFLSRMGYRCDLAANGVEAVEAVARQSYDVVLMDVQMPEMNGIEATREIRRRQSGGASPQIIAMTAHAREEDRAECLSCGMDDYLSKPMRPRILAQKLMEAAARRGAAVVLSA